MSGGRTVILTGSSSFIGVHLAIAFAAAGWRVIATHGRQNSRYDEIRAQRLAIVEKIASLRLLDVCNGAAVAAVVERETPDLWIQQAGFAENCGSVDYDVDRGLAVNAASLQHLFRALHGGSCGVIITGSDAEYGGSEKAHREDDWPHPELPYGVCKLAATVFAEQQSAWHGVPARVARLYIPIGTMDNPRRLLMASSSALMAGRPVDLSPCSQRRDVIGISDVARAYLLLAEDMKRGGFEVFNISSGEALELAELLRKLARALGADQGLLRFGAMPLRPGEPTVAFGSNDKARARLGWQPRPIDQALREDLVEPILAGTMEIQTCAG